MSAWLLLFGAIAFELIGSSALKASHGFSRRGPTLLLLACYMVSFWLLAQALLSVPLGVAYTVWSGIGILGTSAIGMVLFGERLNRRGALGIAMVLIGVVVLQLLTPVGA